MITLTNLTDFVLLFLLTGTAGLIGGLAAELLLTRDGETGAFELPARKGAVFDLGGIAALLVGAVVGVAILIVFPPETTIVTNAADGSTTSVRGYDVVRLVATSLVAGSAGGSVLSGLQARVTAAVNESRVQFTAAAAQLQIDQMLETATATVGDAARAGAAGGAARPGGARPRGALGDAGPEAPAEPDAAAEAAAQSGADALRRQAEHSKAAIATAAASRRG
jgi:hypothetical protein